jgi:predicted amidohydrolase YtcJ
MKLRLFLFTFFVLTVSAPAQRPAPDLILINGKIFTSNVHQLHVEALAIRDGRIVAVGTTQQITALAGSATKRIDVAGRTVVPGFNDAHDHINLDPEHVELPFSTMDPHWQQVTEAITTAVARAPKGTWIRGSIGVSVLEDPLASRAALDQLAPDHPVMLYVWTGHSSILNTLALRELGIAENEPNPEGGRYVRDPATGKLTGLIFEFAEFQAAKRFSELATEPEAQKQLKEFFAGVARWGITSVQNMSVPLTQQRAASLFSKESPPIRVRAIWFGYTDQHGRLTAEGHAQPIHSPTVTISGIKWILDGTPVVYSCALRKPYTDRPNTSGSIDFTQKEIEAMLRESLAANQQLMVHLCGDRATETFLNAMEATGGKAVWSARRVRIEHGDGLAPDLIPRARALNVIVVQNPTHLALPELLTKRVGAERVAQLQPLRSILNAGIPLALGSDGPNNPYLNIMLASVYPGKPGEAITREQAVIAYTLTSAYAEFAEKEKGSLEPGKLADLAVLSQDIFTVTPDALLKTESVLTLVGGKVVYDAHVLAPSQP